MHKNSFLFLLLSCFLTLTTQAQQGIYYQAVARSTDGTPLINRAINVKFLIHDTTATGKVVYSEKHNVTTDILGMFSVVVGQGTVLSGTFSSINWGVSAKFVQQDLDTSGTATQFFTVGTQQLMSVPYALYAYNGLPNGKFNGDMLVWNGSKWDSIPKGQTGQVLAIDNAGSPRWSGYANTSNFYGISTYSVYNITDSIAYTGGKYNFYNASGQPVIAQGVCWSTNNNPTVALSTKTIDSAIGNFDSKLTGLAPKTTYYVRAYCTTSAGTTYGNEISFTTIATNSALFHLGQYYGGGIIFYIDNSGKHGLIMDTIDLENIYSTSPYGSFLDNFLRDGVDPSPYSTLVTSSQIGTGRTNTSVLLSNIGADCPPVYLCKMSNRAGYNDWYLPSFEELKLMFRQNYLSKTFFRDYEIEANYHNSTLQSGYYTYTYVNMKSGLSYNATNLYQGRTRAIRSF